MSHPDYLRLKARQLRIERRYTIDELAERLALSRSTIYYWVRDLPIPGSGPGGEFPLSARRKGTLAMQRKYRLLREAAYQEGVESFEALSVDPTFRDFVCMYIGEGYKRNRNSVSICNSDPTVVTLGNRWLRRLSSRRPHYAIQYHVDQDLSELQAFWSRTLDVEPEVLRLQRKSNSNQMSGRMWRSQYGVLAVGVSDTLLRARLQAWMDLVRKSWQ
jgi:excisionase family DNA binding protein